MPIGLTTDTGSGIRSLRREALVSGTGESLLIVPTRRRVREMTRECVRAAPQGVTPAVELYTLELFAQKILAHAFPHHLLLDEQVQAHLFHDAVMASQSRFRYFMHQVGRRRIPHGTHEKLVGVIKHFRESGLSSASLVEEIEGAPEHEREKLRDVASVYQVYEHFLHTHAWIDTEGMMTALAREIPAVTFERAFRSTFPHVSSIVLAGFGEFLEPELDVIQRLSRTEGVSITLLFDYLPGNSSLFGQLDENYRRFTGLGFKSVPAIEHSSWKLLGMNTDSTLRACHDGLARSLFTDQPARQHLTGTVTLVQARDRRLEVDAICRVIKDLHREDSSIDLGRVCVAMYRPQLYTDLFRERLASYGIPANITDRYSLARSSLVVSILNVFKLLLGGWRRDDLLKVLCSPYFTFGSGVEAFREVSARLRITGGLHGSVVRMEKRLEELACLNDTSESGQEMQAIESERRAIAAARRLLLSLEGVLAPLIRNTRTSEFREALLRTLNHLGVERNMLVVHRTHPHLVERDARAYGRFRELVDAMVRYRQAMGSGDLPMPLADHVEKLQVAVMHERYNVREEVGKGVLVTSIEETRGLPIDVMIVAGLVDGEFPLPYEPEVFFGGKRLRQREQRHILENRYLFYQGVTNWTQRLFLTYPEQDGGRELVRSSFIDEFLRAADVTEVRYPPPAQEVLHSLEELQVFHGSAIRDGVTAPITASYALDSSLQQIDRVVRIERSRSGTHDLPAYEGILTGQLSAAARDRLANLKDRIFSVSQLETYAACPYRFFVDRVLHLRVPDDLIEELTPPERGTLLHEALFDFYDERRAAGLPPLAGCSDEEYQYALMRLAIIVERKIDALHIADPFWAIEREELLDQHKGILPQYLASERGRSDQLTPEYFEVAFGVAGLEPKRRDRVLSTPRPLELGTVRIHGKVDRVDVGQGLFAVVDYKSGARVPGIEDVRRGLSLQLSIYLFAVEQLLAQLYENPPSPAAGIYVQLRSPVRRRLGLAAAEYRGIAFEDAIPVSYPKTGSQLRELVREAVEQAAGYVEKMSQGIFPLTSMDLIDKVCGHCHFNTICRIQTVRHIAEGGTDDSQ